MQDLKITLFQTELYWENIQANLSTFEEKIWKIGEETDVILLPEMFNTGFSMNAKEMAEPMNSTTFRWMKQMAEQTGSLLISSYIVYENDNYYNRCLWMQPDGEFATYDKRHLFRMADEDQHYTAGTKRLIKEWKGWRICPMICYDLRFPAWSRNINDRNELEFDLLIYVANWPSPRINAWDVLLQARAVENQCYVAGLNRIGSDDTGKDYPGHSAVVDPKGERLLYVEDHESISTVTLSYQPMAEYREKFPINLDADLFTIQ